LISKYCKHLYYLAIERLSTNSDNELNISNSLRFSGTRFDPENIQEFQNSGWISISCVISFCYEGSAMKDLARLFVPMEIIILSNTLIT